MSKNKLKLIASVGIIAATAALPKHTAKEDASAPSEPRTELSPAVSAPALQTPKAKRKAKKVYHRFEQIPAVSDKEAALYSPDEYTYILNADTYQKNGSLELKRVLKAELTRANILSLVYRSECQTYNPKKNEDQLAKYVIDLKVMSKTGIAKGPSQMEDNAVTAFARYLAANHETRAYVLPFMHSASGNKEETARKLERKFFTPNGDLHLMEERDAALQSKLYRDLSFDTKAWQKLASPRLKDFIKNEEARMSQKVNKEIILSDITKNYLCLTEAFPSPELLIEHLEEFNLAFYQLGRKGKTKHVMAALARSMNLKTADGNLNSTRIPPFVIAAAVSSINWQGNGRQPLTEAVELRRSIQNTDDVNTLLRATVKNWVTGKSKRYGVDELAELNILTPNIIHQYKVLELTGAEMLAHEYTNAVTKAEEKIRAAQPQRIAVTPQKTASSSRPAQTAQAPATDNTENILNKGKTLILSAVDFIKGR